MFNLSGSEIVFILLLALVVLGPEKLPDALRRAGRTYAELKKMGNTFQSEVRGAFDEPVKEMRETADMLRKAASFDADDDRPDTKTRVLLRDPGEVPPEQRVKAKVEHVAVDDRPPADAGDDRPPADAGDDRPPADAGDDHPLAAEDDHRAATEDDRADPTPA